MNKKSTLFFMSLLLSNIVAKPPKLTVVFVVDGFANYVIPHIKPHLKGGLKYLLEHGVVYKNAHQPHGMPATAPGHAGINTGTYPETHGIVANKWYNKSGKKIYADQDSPENAAVLTKNGQHDYGRSSRLMEVDGVSDQFILQTPVNKKNIVYAISSKSRAAISLAGKLGKALWFDYEQGNMTSSKAYFDTLPSWVHILNNKYNIPQKSSELWQSIYPKTSPAYAYAKGQTYQYTRTQNGINMQSPITNNNKPAKLYKPFIHLPQAQEMLFDYAYTCLENTLLKNRDTNMLLWISISGLDRTGHLFGPQSFEYLDMIYHIDQQIDTFIRKITKQIDKKDIAFALTSDHGISPIVEKLQKKGYANARRINSKKLAKKLNTKLQEKFNIKNLITNIKIPSVFIDEKNFNELSRKKQSKVNKTLKKTLKQEHGIKDVWTIKELLKMPLDNKNFAYYLKKQLYGNRNGHLIIQALPFTYISDNDAGTGHKTPYGYNTHVPLIFYYPNQFEKQTIEQKVFVPQLAPTLAHILEVPKPTACVFEPLIQANKE